MSKLSWFYIVIITAGLVFIAGVREYRSHQEKVQAELAAAQEAQYQPAPELVATAIQLPVFERVVPKTEIYLEDVKLPPALNREQARQTIVSILDDYRDDVNLQAFYTDLQKSTGQKIDLADLSGENMPRLMRRYPQITQIIEQHAQNEAFSKVLEEIFSNPQFVRSVAILQQGKQN